MIFLYLIEILYLFYFLYTSLQLQFFKNVSSSISDNKLRLSGMMKLRDFKKILTRAFIYEPFFIEIYMNANIMKMQIIYLTKYDLEGE